jgi:hypothetical protein
LSPPIDIANIRTTSGMRAVMSSRSWSGAGPGDHDITGVAGWSRRRSGAVTTTDLQEACPLKLRENP